MNQNVSGAVLLLLIGAGGIAFNHPAALLLAIVTAALAFLTEEVRSAEVPALFPVGIGLAITSWLTAIAAFTILVL